MLIDDDYLSLMKLEKMFPWNKYSFKNICSTTDPKYAIEQLLVLKPDVVFTDVQMCGFNGFDIIDFAKKQNMNTLFVIISGYDYFEYAQKAIRLNVIDYMLKPVTSEDCDRIFALLKDILDNNNVLTKNKQIVPSSKYHINNKNFYDLIEYINNHVTESLSLMDLSKKFSLNLSYSCQLFQKYFSCSFSEYVMSLKLQNSIELLIKSDMKISDIANHFNYDYSHFCKIFKKEFGVTPYVYRNLIQKKEESSNETNEKD